MYLINQKPQLNNTSLPDQVYRGYQNTGGNQTTRGILKYRGIPEYRGILELGLLIVFENYR